MNLREKFETSWRIREYKEFSPSLLKVDLAFKELDGVNKSLIDFGCGTGEVSNVFFNLGISSYTGIDVAGNCYTQHPNIFWRGEIKDFSKNVKYHIGFSVNVFENIPPEDINKSLEVVSNSVDKFFISVSFHEDTFGPKFLGESLHLTVQPPEWWELKLGQYFSTVKMVDSNSWVCNN